MGRTKKQGIPSVVMTRVGDLTPYARNSRTHSDEQIAQIAASIKEFGWTNPILIDGEKGIIAGHGRLKAAMRLGLEEIPAIELSHLTEIQKKALIIADNKLALNAGWDNELLSLELEELELEGLDLSLTGFGEEEISALKPEVVNEGLTDEDAVPEPPPEPITKPGDIWILGKHRLMCGDSTSVDAVDKLMQGKKADMVFTDPPYGVNYEGGHFHSGDVNITRKREKLVNDNSDQIYADVIPVIASFCDGPCYTWFADTKPLKLYQSVEALGEIHALIIWHKTNATYAAMNAQYKQRHEPCLYWKPKGSTLRWCGASTENTLWELKKDGKNSFHPTQKPVELSEKAISNHDAKVVLDLFGGSGSTMIGCEKTGRSCRMMELDPKYCDVIVKRWEEFTGQKARLENAAEIST
jgi:DNA modification methylase